MNDQHPKPPANGGALAVWLKLIALLAGLSAFGLLMFWLSKMAHPGG